MDMKKIGGFIKQSRQALNISQQALGKHLFVTDKAVSKWERGLSCPDADNLKNMSLLFNCSVSEIINGQRQDLTQSSNIDANIKNQQIDSEDYGRDVKLAFKLDSTSCISPFLFGDNLEHTRGCIYGGLTAQMLKNRKFIGKPGRFGCALAWYQIGDNAYLTFSNSYTHHYEGYKMNRAHECNAQQITSFYSNGTAGIGQKEIYLTANTQYEFSIVARAFKENELYVQLSSCEGVVYDKKKISIKTDAWQEKKVILTSDVADPNANIEIFFIGEGTVHIGAVSLLPLENFHGMRLDVIQKMKEEGIKLLRWPGGNFAGEYNWKDGLLPHNERAPLQSYLGLETQPHSWGYDFHEINTDDFVALCREIGAEPFITINPTWNTPEESAQWVEYCNGDTDTPYGALRAKNGHPEPYNVQFWSLGNEFGYGHMEGANTPYDYSRIVLTHAEQMLKVTSELTLCSSGPYPHEQWVNHSAKILSKVAPIVSLHHYAQYPQYVDSTMRKEEYYGFINKVYTECLPKIQTLRNQLNDDNIKISFDEWNAWYAWYRGGSVSEGIFAASFLNMLFMNADKYGVSLACHFESVNEGAIKVLPGKAVLTPTGQAMSIMKYHANGIVCALDKDVVVTKKDNVITCTFINRSFDEDKTFTFDNLGKITQSVCYTSDDVVPNTIFEQLELDPAQKGNAYFVMLPPHSIALIKITL